jgi:hypothetical protein
MDHVASGPPWLNLENEMGPRVQAKLTNVEDRGSEVG